MKKTITTLAVAIVFVILGSAQAQQKMERSQPIPFSESGYQTQAIKPFTSFLLPDLKVGIAIVSQRYVGGYYNKQWTVTVGVKNFGGNKGIVEGNQMPLYVNFSYYDKYYKWNYQTSRFDLRIELKHKINADYNGFWGA